jgi:kynureninase
VAADDVAERIGRDDAVLMLTEVDYRTGRRHDMADLTRRAREAGALTLWDLAHSAGAFPVALDACGVDLAVGCGYKFLNGGPGAPAFLYVAARHQDRIAPPLSGWMGHEAPFAFTPDYRPGPGIRRQLCGTPAVLGLAALEIGVDLALDADLEMVRRKSLSLTDAFIALVEAEVPGTFEVITPRDARKRGSQVSLRQPDGYAIVQALIARGVIPDFRPPDILRFGFAPLYLRHADVGEAVKCLREVMVTGAWRDPIYARRATVT